MSGYDISVTTEDGSTYLSYVVGDMLPVRPAIILFSAIFGVDDDMKQMAQRWAERGYLVAVPDYFHRVSSGVLDRSEEGRKAAVTRWQALDVDTAIRDTRALIEHLRGMSSCNGKIAALGFCAGGELAFLAATRLGVSAAAAFHGTNIDRHLDEAHNTSGAMTLHFGDNDKLIPAAKITKIKEHLEKCLDIDIHVHAGAEHGFSFPGRPSYHSVAATESDRCAQFIFDVLKTTA